MLLRAAKSKSCWIRWSLSDPSISCGNCVVLDVDFIRAGVLGMERNAVMEASPIDGTSGPGVPPACRRLADALAEVVGGSNAAAETTMKIAATMAGAMRICRSQLPGSKTVSARSRPGGGFESSANASARSQEVRAGSATGLAKAWCGNLAGGLQLSRALRTSAQMLLYFKTSVIFELVVDVEHNVVSTQSISFSLPSELRARASSKLVARVS